MITHRIVAVLLGLLAVPTAAQQPQLAYTATTPPQLTSRIDKQGTGTELGTTLLWDQTDFGLNAWTDQTFSDLPSFDTFQVVDVTTGGAAWKVTRVTTYFTRGSGLGDWSSGITTGRLQVYPKTGSLPTASDVTPEYSVPITLVEDGGITWRVEADTSGIVELNCISGDFWIGLSPDTEFAAQGQEFHWVVSAVDVDSAERNPGGGFGLGTAWTGLSTLDTIGAGGPYEAAITLEGEELLGDTWVDLGAGTALTSTFWAVSPVATGSGFACANQTVTVGCTFCGPPFAGTNLVVGALNISAPFKGGTLVPTPDLIIPLPTFASGDISVPFTWPSGIPGGFPFYLQFWQKEPPWSASNGLEVTSQ